MNREEAKQLWMELHIAEIEALKRDAPELRRRQLEQRIVMRNNF